MKDLIRRTSLEPLLDDMFKGFFVRPFGFEAGADLAGGIKLDVKEDDKAYTVHADIPGVKKEDISVQIEGGRVQISAEVKKESETKEGERVLRSERYYGQVSRSFQLAQDVDQSTATARYSDGVLELTLPKKTGGTSRQLTIE